jgi:hypothetical protein
MLYLRFVRCRTIPYRSDSIKNTFAVRQHFFLGHFGQGFGYGMGGELPKGNACKNRGEMLC